MIQSKNERLNEILQAVRSTFYDCMNTLSQSIKPFLDNKMSIFEEYGALNKGVSPLGNTYTGDLAGIQTGLEFIAKLDPVRKKNCAYLN